METHTNTHTHARTHKWMLAVASVGKIESFPATTHALTHTHTTHTHTNTHTISLTDRNGLALALVAARSRRVGGTIRASTLCTWHAIHAHGYIQAQTLP